MLKKLREARRGIEEIQGTIEWQRYAQTVSYMGDIVKKEIVGRISATHRRVLDFGCGFGALADYLIKAGKLREYVGLDISLVRLKMAKARLNDLTMGLVLGVGEFLPFREDSFDVTVCCGVLQHVVNQQKAVDEMTRTTRLDGLVIVTDLRKDWVKAWIKYFPPTLPLLIAYLRRARNRTPLPKGVRHVYFSGKDLRDLLTNSGLKILERQRLAFCPPFRFSILFSCHLISFYKHLNRVDSLQRLRAHQLLVATK